MTDTAARLSSSAHLVAWLVERGAVINGIAAEAVRDPIGGFEHIGMHATRDISAGEELLRIPRALTLDVTSIIANGTTHLARRPSLAAHFPNREGALLTSALIESTTDAFWQPYLRTLPSSYLDNPGLWWGLPGTFARTIRAATATRAAATMP